MSQRSEIVAIQYLRGFCAVAVVIDHSTAMASFPKYFGVEFFHGALGHGRLGVDIFFVISGFIITVVALKSDSWQPSLPRISYFTKRFARIVPLMWIAILSYLVLRMVATDTPITPLTYARAALLWPYGQVEPNNIWTLRHEFIFYVLFALTWLGRTRALRWLLLLWFASPIAYALATGIFWQTIPNKTLLPIVFNSVNLEFGAGMLVGLAWLRRPPRRMVRLPVHPAIAFALLTLAVMIASALNGLTWMSVPATLFTAVLAAGLVGFATMVECPRDHLSKFGRLLGNASYAIYLFHPHMVSGLLAIASRLLHKQHPELAVIVIIVLATAAGIAIHLWIEKPLVRAVQRRLPAPPPIAVRSEG